VISSAFLLIFEKKHGFRARNADFRRMPTQNREISGEKRSREVMIEAEFSVPHAEREEYFCVLLTLCVRTLKDLPNRWKRR
jgi:hypothetical protein